MNAFVFDRVSRRLVGRAPRRAALRLLALVLALGPVATRPRATAAACRATGKACRHRGQCCSGRCSGKKGRKRCRPVPNQGICTIADNGCTFDDRPDVVCGTSGDIACLCMTTVGGEAFCANTFGVGKIACGSDADCAAALGSGARCIRPAAACGSQPICKPPCPALFAAS